MRRAPQLWEQRLARTTAILGAGISSSGDATAIVPPSPPPGAGGGIEPAPVAPAPGLFIAPSAPTLFKQVQAINVLWDGLNSAGDLWPYDTAWVEIHMSTANGFTPGTATLKGRLARPGSYTVGGLTAGVPYYFKLRGADPSGSYTSASTQVSSTTGSASSGDIVTIEGDQIIGGTITGQYIAGGTVTGTYLSGGTISGGFITGGTIDGASLRTAASGARVEIGSAFSALSSVALYASGGYAGGLVTDLSGGVTVSGASGKPVGLNGSSIEVTPQMNCASGLDVTGLIEGDTLKISGANVDMQGVYDNNTTGIDNVGITGGPNYRLRRISSSQDIKYDITPVAGELSASVDPERISDVATVDPLAILDVAVTEFSVIDDGQPTGRRVLGFIADDVADKLPVAVTRYDDGRPAGVLDTSLIAAVLAVVKDQAATITDLRARIEALEA
jgi:hypothetical protein